jgi:outer membrane protein assembly factor BamB
MTLIELGEVSSGAEHGPGPWAGGFNRRLVRQAGLALVAVLCVLTVTGSARPEPRGLRTLWSISEAGDDFSVVGDMAFVLSPQDGRMLTAYDLTDGSIRWERRVAAETSHMTAAEEAGVLLLPATFTDLSTATDGTEYFAGDVNLDVLAVDAHTGATLWQQRGDVYSTTADTVLLSRWDPITARISNLKVVRLSDGVSLWSRDYTSVTHVVTTGVGDHPDKIITATVDGRVDVLRWADGTRLVGARLPWVPDPAPEGWYADMTTIGDTLYVAQTETMHTAVTAYALDALRPKWQVLGPPSGTASNCGSVLCVSDGVTMTAYDAETGAQLWHTPGWTWASPLSPGRLLGEYRVAASRAVLDERTGRLVADLGTGFAQWDEVNQKLIVLRFTASPAGFSTVTEVDPDTGASSLLGKVDAATEGRCWFRDDRLVCQHLTGALTVTDVG